MAGSKDEETQYEAHVGQNVLEAEMEGKEDEAIHNAGKLPLWLRYVGGTRARRRYKRGERPPPLSGFAWPGTNTRPALNLISFPIAPNSPPRSAFCVSIPPAHPGRVHDAPFSAGEENKHSRRSRVSSYLIGETGRSSVGPLTVRPHIHPL